MILLVKNNKKNLSIKKYIIFFLLFVMFYYYYNHMSDEYQAMNKKLSIEIAEKNQIINQKINNSLKLEKIIYKEAEKSVELIGQEKIQRVEIQNNKLLIICDYDSNIEPIFLRYGINALVKSSYENIKILIDIQFIIENDYET